MLPDYVIGGVADDTEYEFRLSPSEAAIARATKADIVLPEGQQSGGVLLARLTREASATNVVTSTTAGSVKISQIVAPPPAGNKLQLFTSRGSASTTIKALTGAFVVVDRITGPGDGGGPVLDDGRALVAMAYSGSGTESQFLSLNWLVAKKPGLKLM